MDPFTFLAHLRQIPSVAVAPVLLTLPRQFEDAQVASLHAAAAASSTERPWARLLAGVGATRA
jgi:hypothetical protein